MPGALSLADAYAVLDIAANTPGTGLNRAVNAELADWDMHALLLRQLIHSVQVSTWVAAGGKKSGSSYPKPLPLPGETDTQGEQLADGEALDMDDAERKLEAKYSITE